METRRKVIGVPLGKDFTKQDDGTLLVPGYFTSDNKDEVGDIITRSATERAVPKYRQWGNIRYMHMPRPVGKVTRIGTDDGLKWNEVEIRVIDPQAIFEVEQGLLPALSVGILVDWDAIDFMEDGGWIINDYDLAEISLVDHPANYDARLKDLELTSDLRAMVREKGFSALLEESDTMTKSWKKEKQEMAEKAKELESTEEVIEEEVTTEETDVEDTPEAEETVEDAEASTPEPDAEKTLEEEEETEVEETDEEVEEEVEDEPAVEEEEEVVEIEPDITTEGDSMTAAFKEVFIPAIEELTKKLDELAEVVKGPAEAPEVQAEIETEEEPADETISVEESFKQFSEEIEKLKAEIAELKAPAERKGYVKVDSVEAEDGEAETEEGAEPKKPANLTEALKGHFEARYAD